MTRRSGRLRRGLRLGWLTWLLVGLSLAACTAPLGMDGSGGLPCPLPGRPQPGEEEVEFEIVNDTCRTICSINVSPTACDDWGAEDWIGRDNLYPGESVLLSLPLGRLDLLIEDCTQDVYIAAEIDTRQQEQHVILDPEGGRSQTCAASLTVKNQSEVPICHMWIGAPTSESFGLNWLGDDRIAAGASRTFFLLPGTYDVKAEDCAFRVLRVETDAVVESHQTWTVP